jgi:hypothetical protein
MSDDREKLLTRIKALLGRQIAQQVPHGGAEVFPARAVPDPDG